MGDCRCGALQWAYSKTCLAPRCILPVTLPKCDIHIFPLAVGIPPKEQASSHVLFQGSCMFSSSGPSTPCSVAGLLPLAVCLLFVACTALCRRVSSAVVADQGMEWPHKFGTTPAKYLRTSGWASVQHDRRCGFTVNQSTYVGVWVGGQCHWLI